MASAGNDHEGIHNLQSMDDYKKALEQPGVMVIDAFATWCGPCKMIAPKVAQFSKTYSDARFYKVDIDEVPDVASELSITAMPTFVLFKDGERGDTVVGASAPALMTAIQKALEIPDQEPATMKTDKLDELVAKHGQPE